MRKIAVALIAALCVSSGAFLFAEGESNLSLREAVALSKDGRFEESIAAVKEIIGRTSGDENRQAHQGLGLVYFKARQYDNALAEFTTTVSMRKESPMAYYFMALIHEKQAVAEKDAAARKELKGKALASWHNYLAFAGKGGGDPAKPRPHIKIKIEKGIKTAKKHIATLERELYGKN